MELRPEIGAEGPHDAGRGFYTLSTLLHISGCYVKAVAALQELARALETTGEVEHANAALSDSIHIAELFEQAKLIARAATELHHRSSRHMLKLHRQTAANQ